jgi:hypothetical protein
LSFRVARSANPESREITSQPLDSGFALKRAPE